MVTGGVKGLNIFLLTVNARQGRYIFTWRT